MEFVYICCIYIISIKSSFGSSNNSIVLFFVLECTVLLSVSIMSKILKVTFF